MAWELNSDRPIYTQVLERIQARIIAGTYQPGERLPSVRELAAEASVNPNTMQRAFTELERSGLIQTQRNSGRTVTEDADMIKSIQTQAALLQVSSFFNTMTELGFNKEEILAFVREAGKEGEHDGTATITSDN